MKPFHTLKKAVARVDQIYFVATVIAFLGGAGGAIMISHGISFWALIPYSVFIGVLVSVVHGVAIVETMRAINSYLESLLDEAKKKDLEKVLKR